MSKRTCNICCPLQAMSIFFLLVHGIPATKCVPNGSMYLFDVFRASAQVALAEANVFSLFVLKGTQEARRYISARAWGPSGTRSTCNRCPKSLRLALVRGEAFRKKKAFPRIQNLFAFNRKLVDACAQRIHAPAHHGQHGINIFERGIKCSGLQQ